MKRIKTLFAVAASLCSIVATSQASFILNGDFELGNNGDFTSGYVYDASANGLASGSGTVFPEAAGSGKYGVGSSANFFHSAFTTVGDHTSGSGNMMVVNGSVVAGKNVWSGTVAPPLSIGTTYQFSAWVMNVYPTSPADLQFSFGGNVLGSFSPTGNGVWQEFTATFVATANQTSGAVDLNIDSSGNDFALDDISLTAVPEPTTMIAGGLLLLPFGASTLRFIRKNRTA